MKKITTLLFVLVFGFNSFAQNQKKQAAPDFSKEATERAEKMTDYLKKRCKLNDEQSAKVLEINKASLDKIYALRNNRKEGENNIKAGVKKIQEERLRAIRGVLFPDQQQSFDGLRADHKKHLEKNPERAANAPDSFDF